MACVGPLEVLYDVMSPLGSTLDRDTSKHMSFWLVNTPSHITRTFNQHSVELTLILSLWNLFITQDSRRKPSFNPCCLNAMCDIFIDVPIALDYGLRYLKLSLLICLCGKSYLQSLHATQHWIRTSNILFWSCSTLSLWTQKSISKPPI